MKKCFYHTTIESNFKKIKKQKKIVCRKQSNKEAISNIYPSHPLLIYFSCNLKHNMEFISIGNVVDQNIPQHSIQHLFQIKVCFNYKHVKQHITIKHDEDSFLKPILNAVSQTLDFDLNVIYDLNQFNPLLYKKINYNLTQKIIQLLPHKIFKTNSQEHFNNIKYLTKKLNRNHPLLNLYYKINKPDSYCVEKEFDMKKLKKLGVKFFYRKITVKYTDIYKTATNSSLGFEIIRISYWKQI